MNCFDSAKYYQLQTKAILDRISKFPNGRLYLEVGGKLLNDPHASRVLPGFDPQVKLKIFNQFHSNMDVIYCVNANDIGNNRLLKEDNESYHDVVFQMIDELSEKLGVTPFIAVNLIERTEAQEHVDDFIEEASDRGYEVFKRYKIKGYPDDINAVVSETGYGADEHIPVTQKLVLVTGAASNSGKLSTCLGQVYLDKVHGYESGYAKYELFPIWNLPLTHPVNLAYEAATADIGDYNVQDYYHLSAHGESSVNYNRDVEAFEILIKLAEKIVSPENYITSYKSPTDMGINMAGFCITDDDVAKAAGIAEIEHRCTVFEKQLFQGGKEEWVDRCEALLHLAKRGL